jgi:hypothetical protein
VTKTAKHPVKRGRIGRFFYVGSKRSRVLHLSHHITDGYRTLCGVLLTPGKWKWARTPAARRNVRRKHLCKKCMAVAPQIIVCRVRRGGK